MRTTFLFLAICASLVAQPVFPNVFPPDEYAARRARVMEKIGDAAAIVLGTTEPPGEMPLRQNNQFHYLCGVVEPRAILVLDGRTKKTTLFLNPRNPQRETSMYGPGLYPSEEAARQTGVDGVLPRVPAMPGAGPGGRGPDAASAAPQQRSEFQAMMEGFAAEGRTVYTPFRAEVLGSISAGDPDRLWSANRSDPWDGRPSREEAFRAHLKAVAPASEIKTSIRFSMSSAASKARGRSR
jgi:Xaa-Pro aminopeptidase